MDRLLEFATNHPLLVSGFFAVLGALLWTFLSGAARHSVSSAQAVLLLNKEGGVPVDIRGDGNYRAGHIINAVNINPEQFDEAVKKLDKHKAKPILVYCESGTSSAKVVTKLRHAGFTRAAQLQGGIAAWRQDNLPLEKAK